MEPTVVFFSVECNGRPAPYRRVINITAIEECRDVRSPYELYVVPAVDILPDRTERCGLKVNNGRLYLQGRRLRNAHPARAALRSFVAFLKSVAGRHGKVILVSYGERDDSAAIVEMASTCGLMKKFEEVVAGFADLSDVYARKGYQGDKSIDKFTNEVLHKSMPTDTALQRVVIYQELFFLEGALQILYLDLLAELRSIDTILILLEGLRGTVEVMAAIDDDRARPTSGLTTTCFSCVASSAMSDTD